MEVLAPCTVVCGCPGSSMLVCTHASLQPRRSYSRRRGHNVPYSTVRDPIQWNFLLGSWVKKCWERVVSVCGPLAYRCDSLGRLVRAALKMQDPNSFLCAQECKIQIYSCAFCTSSIAVQYGVPVHVCSTENEAEEFESLVCF